MQCGLMLASDVETVAEITAAYRAGAVAPADIMARSYARMRALNDPAVFISILDEGEALKEAQALDARGDRNLPLFGIPVAVKDNIDVRGFLTTAACPDFAYRAAADAAAVARLRQAGAIIVGKTNLDQFATGLVGVRSPYGVPRNPLDPKLIPGGSSSGSAVAVATGIVPAALGTDTAGSGRVPALFNNIVGLKPSLGLVSTAGLVPACRTLDCVSVFAHTTDDCSALLAIMAGFDDNDPYSRRRPLQGPGAPPTVRLGVPQPGQRIFFGDGRAAADYAEALDRLARLGAVIVDIDIEPFYETARLLYEGPWLAERYAATRDLIASSPQSMHPVTLQIILDGARPSAVDAFMAFYRLEQLRRIVQRQFEAIDALVLPTAPTLYTVDQVLADPIGLNSRLGTYTNFVNLLDLCGLAVPAALHPGPSGAAPFGITLLASGGNDGLLAAIGRRFHADIALPLGALNRKAQPSAAPLPGAPPLADRAIPWGEAVSSASPQSKSAVADFDRSISGPNPRNSEVRLGKGAGGGSGGLAPKGPTGTTGARLRLDVATDSSPPPCGEGSGVGVEPVGTFPPQGVRESTRLNLAPMGTTATPDPSPQGEKGGSARCDHPALAGEGSEGEIGDAVLLAVVGAHLSGMPLNHELRAHGSRFVVATATAPDYRLYALPGAIPPKPGLLRVAAGQGSAITLELWAMPLEAFGRFAAAVPLPLSIGSVRLADGRWVKGFLVEAEAVNGARDISSFGGWREFVAKANFVAPL
jgi:allophanate hydrolase